MFQWIFLHIYEYFVRKGKIADYDYLQILHERKKRPVPDHMHRRAPEKKKREARRAFGRRRNNKRGAKKRKVRKRKEKGG